MPFDPEKFRLEILKYSSLTQTLIALGFDAVRGIKALLSVEPLTEEQRQGILAAVMSNSIIRETLALKDAGKL
jgi:hypothetical protein